MDIQCIQCGNDFRIRPARKDIAKYCSFKCKGLYQSEHLTGENHPRWQGGVREKQCQECGKTFHHNVKRAYSLFKKQKFCSKKCADIGGFRYTGEDHPNYREDARRKNRGGPHKRWRDAVITRDNGTCQHCGATEIELHAHHIKEYRDYPELRFDVDNGLTLCYRCHWAVHTANDANGVNSGELLTGGAEDNPEPSLSGNVQEGATTRGRAYRRVETKCAWCGVALFRALSDVKGKQWSACSHRCSAKYSWSIRQRQ